MEQIVTQMVSTMYTCKQCPKCKIWHVEDKPHSCEQKKLDKEAA